MLHFPLVTADSFFRQYDEVDRDSRACYQLSALVSGGARILIGAPALVLPVTPPGTTNGLERLNQEIKLRMWVVRIFSNREACLRLVTALAIEQSEECVTGRRYLDMRKLEKHRPEERGPRR